MRFGSGAPRLLFGVDNRGMLGEHGRARGDAADIMLAEVARGEMFLSAFACLGHRGNYHVWNARGGEYEYPGQPGEVRR